jgi:uncharacterized membrane protein YphA (DoxX/SURF4 family)
VTFMSKTKLLQISATLLRCAAGLLFVYAGVAKLIDPFPFGAALAEADWLPETFARVLLAGLPAAEVGLGLALFSGLKLRMVAAGAFLLVAAFTVFLLVETARGNTGCGCFGGTRLPAFFSTAAGALLRNGLLLFALGWLGRRAVGERISQPDRLEAL